MDPANTNISGSLTPNETPPWAPVVGERCWRNYSVEVRRNKTAGAEVENRTTVIINTGDGDRHGTIIDPAGGDFTFYNQNPVVLINHDRDLLAASSTVTLKNGKHIANVEDDTWDLDDEKILRWFRKLKKGLLRMASIGFIPLEVEKEMIDPKGDPYDWRNIRYIIRKWEALEWSFTTIGSNRGALVTQRMLTGGASNMDSFSAQSLESLSQSGSSETRTTPSAADEPAADEQAESPDEMRGDQAQTEAPPAPKTIYRAATDAEMRKVLNMMVPLIDERIKRHTGRS